MKRFATSVRKKGFSIIEIILAAIVLGGFIHAALILSSQILTTRADGSFELDRRAWAALEARLAIEGVDPQVALVDMHAPTNNNINTDSSFFIGSSTTLKAAEQVACLDIIPFTYGNNRQEGRNNCRMGMYLNAAANPAVALSGNFGLKVTIELADGTPKIFNTDNPGVIEAIEIDSFSDLIWPDDPDSTQSPILNAIAEQTRVGAGSDFAIRYSYGNSSPSMGSNPLSNDVRTNILVDDILNAPADDTSTEYHIDLRIQALKTTDSYESSPVLVIPLQFTKINPEIELTRESATNASHVKLDDVIWSMDTDDTDLISQIGTVNSNDLITNISLSDGSALPGYLADKFSLEQDIEGTDLSSEEYTSEVGATKYQTKIPLAAFDYGDSHTRNCKIESNSFLLFGKEETQELTVEETSLPNITFIPGTRTSFTNTIDVEMTADTSADEIFDLIDGEEYLYNILYTTNGDPVTNESQAYTDPVPVGGEIGAGGSVDVRAKAFSKRESLNVFISSNTEDTASYDKISGGDQWRWNNTEGADWNDQDNWIDPNKIPAGDVGESESHQDGKGLALLFGDTIQNGLTEAGTISLGGMSEEPRLGHITFNNSNQYTLTSTDSTPITMDSYGERTSITIEKGSHRINTPLTIERTTNVTIPEDSTLQVKDIRQTDASYNEGIIKLGEGDLVLMADSENDKTVDFLVEEGKLSIRKDNRLEEASTLTLHGGIFDLYDFNQKFTTPMDVTLSSIIDFGQVSSDVHTTLELENLYVDSDSILTIKDWDEPFDENEEYDYSLSHDKLITEEYPGDRTLNRVQFSGKDPGAKWRITDSGGEIIPKTPPTSPGIGYLSVSQDSKIYFDDSDGEGCELTVEGVNIILKKTWVEGEWQIEYWVHNTTGYVTYSKPRRRQLDNYTYHEASQGEGYWDYDEKKLEIYSYDEGKDHFYSTTEPSEEVLERIKFVDNGNVSAKYENMEILPK